MVCVIAQVLSKIYFMGNAGESGIANDNVLTKESYRSTHIIQKYYFCFYSINAKKTFLVVCVFYGYIVLVLLLTSIFVGEVCHDRDKYFQGLNSFVMYACMVKNNT